MVTCGIFLIDPKGRVLIGHPTNHPPNIWSIPKGEPNKNEPNLMAALREFEEETGVNLMQLPWQTITQIGKFLYPNNKKILVAYCVKINQLIDIELFHCKSMVPSEIYGKEVPEIDKFMWATKEEAMQLIPSSQQEALAII